MTAILRPRVTLAPGRCRQSAVTGVATLRRRRCRNNLTWTMEVHDGRKLLLPIYIHHHVNKSLVGYSDSTYQVLTLTSKDLDTKTTEPDKFDGSIDSLKYLHQVQKNAYSTEQVKIRYVSGYFKGRSDGAMPTILRKFGVGRP